MSRAQQKTEFAELTWTEAAASLTDARVPVLLFPVGSTEAHGPHLPLSTDPLISLGMCRRLVDSMRDHPAVRFLTLPTLSYGVTRYAGQFSGTIHISETTLSAVVSDICESLIGQGFGRIVVVNNHFEPEHVRTLHESLERVYSATGVRVGYLDLTRKQRARRLTEEFWRLGSHAGQYESSLILADRPDLVDPVIASLPEVDVNLVAEISSGVKEFNAMGMATAYNGDPSAATTSEGEESFDTLVTMLREVVEELILGSGGQDQPGMYTRV